MATTVDSPRQRLIEAAETHFRRFGFRRTTVEEVTRTAETGKGSFYLHFPSKEDAYLAVVEASLERFVDRAAEVLHTADGAPARLGALVELTAEHYGRDELLRASLFGEASLVDGRIARRAAEIQGARIKQLLAEVLAAGIEEGSIRPNLDIEASAAVVFEIGWAVVRAELEGTADLPLHQALDTLNDIVGLGIMTRSEAAR